MAVQARAGSLRHSIEIQAATTSQDSFGEPDATYSTHCVRPASVRTMSAAERLRNDIDLADEVMMFMVRYDATTATVTPKMRILYRGRYFNIESVRNVEERDRMIELAARTIEYVA